MEKPYVVCHMMTSIDGRIDCGMTAKLRGVDEYYAALGELNADACLSGRVTAKLELADQGEFQSNCTDAFDCERFSKRPKAPTASLSTRAERFFGKPRWSMTSRSS